MDAMILYNFEVDILFRDMAGAKLVVLGYTPPSSEGTTDPQMISYCSNLIGKLLGFRSNLLLTPYQLYRKIIAAGGKIVFDWRFHDEKRTIRADTGTEAT